MAVAAVGAYDGLAVCGRCGELHGACTATPDKVSYCACGRDRRRRSGLPYPDRWAGFDYNTQFELCRCCALEVLVSGSRWSLWFCAECKRRVCDLNGRLGGYVIPIGRHSLMGGVGLAASEIADRAEVERFAHSLAGVFGAMGRLTSWVPEVVASNLTDLGITGLDRDVDLRAYMRAVSHDQIDKARRFDELCEFWTTSR